MATAPASAKRSLQCERPACLYRTHCQQKKLKARDRLDLIRGSLVITGDKHAWKKSPERYWRTVDTSTRATIVQLLAAFYQGKPQLQEQDVIHSGALAAQNMMLAAHALGYSSCLMIGFNPEEIANIINLPCGHCIAMLLALGKVLVEDCFK